MHPWLATGTLTTTDRWVSYESSLPAPAGTAVVELPDGGWFGVDLLHPTRIVTLSWFRDKRGDPDRPTRTLLERLLGGRVLPGLLQAVASETAREGIRAAADPVLVRLDPMGDPTLLRIAVLEAIDRWANLPFDRSSLIVELNGLREEVGLPTTPVPVAREVPPLALSELVEWSDTGRVPTESRVSSAFGSLALTAGEAYVMRGEVVDFQDRRDRRWKPTPRLDPARFPARLMAEVPTKDGGRCALEVKRELKADSFHLSIPAHPSAAWTPGVSSLMAELVDQDGWLVDCAKLTYSELPEPHFTALLPVPDTQVRFVEITDLRFDGRARSEDEWGLTVIQDHLLRVWRLSRCLMVWGTTDDTVAEDIWSRIKAHVTNCEKRLKDLEADYKLGEEFLAQLRGQLDRALESPMLDAGVEWASASAAERKLADG